MERDVEKQVKVMAPRETPKVCNLNKTWEIHRKHPILNVHRVENIFGFNNIEMKAHAKNTQIGYKQRQKEPK